MLPDLFSIVVTLISIERCINEQELVENENNGDPNTFRFREVFFFFLRFLLVNPTAPSSIAGVSSEVFAALRALPTNRFRGPVVFVVVAVVVSFGFSSGFSIIVIIIIIDIIKCTKLKQLQKIKMEEREWLRRWMIVLV